MAVGLLGPEEAVDGGGAWQHASLVENSKKKQKDAINQAGMENEFVSLVKDEDDAYTNKMELEADLETQMRSTSSGRSMKARSVCGEICVLQS